MEARIKEMEAAIETNGKPLLEQIGAAVDPDARPDAIREEIEEQLERALFELEERDHILHAGMLLGAQDEGQVVISWPGTGLLGERNFRLTSPNLHLTSTASGSESVSLEADQTLRNEVILQAEGTLLWRLETPHPNAVAQYLAREIGTAANISTGPAEITVEFPGTPTQPWTISWPLW